MTRAFTASFVVIGAAAGADLIETHSLSVGTVATVAGIVIPAVWWLSRKFTNIDDRFCETDSRFDSVDTRLREMQETIKSLPCPKIVPKVAKVLGVDPDCNEG